jgi:hypothetical protein
MDRLWRIGAHGAYPGKEMKKNGPQMGQSQILPINPRVAGRKAEITAMNRLSGHLWHRPVQAPNVLTPSAPDMDFYADVRRLMPWRKPLLRRRTTIDPGK